MLGILLSEKNLSIVLDEENPQDVDTAFEWKEQGVNFRLNVFSLSLFGTGMVSLLLCGY